ncbi:MAG: hypothetical protein FJ295_05840 [Planctomycetes bacterium]|nr:hypothetical protein [Planctomycetota bacterium]
MALMIPFVEFPTAIATGVVFAIVTAWLALKKGYPPLLGLVAGGIVGPLALVVYAFLPRTEDADQQAEMEGRITAEQTEAAKTRLCPNCRRVLSIAARVCPKCETRLPAESPPPTT